MTNCRWEPVDGFGSLAEYEQLRSRLTEQVQARLASERRISWGRGWGSAWHEEWFRCQVTRETWRLIAPDPPFRGIFKPVKDSRL
ncbi:MAG TPA: hypothetical protein VND96_17740 [Candidatus Micrarchaeaceae archaeon]|nr:hypothetical protein [Candidatus Micrarchaeaceae archaeon]